MKIVFLLACDLSTQAVTFNCKYSVENFPIIGERYLCRANVINGGDFKRLEEILPGHPIGKTNNDVEVLRLENEELSSIPAGIEKIFPNLKAIQLINSNLLTISSEDLKPFPNLLLLAVQMNEVETLEGDLFKYTRKIQSIEFDRNQICDVGEDLLSGLDDLKLAQFEKNVCIDHQAETPEAIEELNIILSIRCHLRRTTTKRTCESHKK